MGVVVAKVDLAFISRGYPFDTATLYVYCDKCGSFSIRSYLGLRKWLLIVIAIALFMGVTFINFSNPGRAYGYLFPLCLLVCMLEFKVFWGDADYMCRKCGHIPTTQYDTLNYSSDISKVDVPEQLIQKRYIGYWPDMYDLDEALKPPDWSAPTNELRPSNPDAWLEAK